MAGQTPKSIGRYQIVKELKSGGMGTVFLARDPRIGQHMGGRFVAIKVLQAFDDPELRARFEREADIAGTLDHRNIVRVYDRDEFDGRQFIVMEYVDGRPLSDLIAIGDAPRVRKLQWMEELCDGLACAHQAGVVHRDIKPANIMIRAQDGVLKIVDFGIARASAINVHFTRGILGTANYMAPEQWESAGSVDHRADIFASGAVFYELLSGRRAFWGTDFPTIFRNIMMEQPEPLDAIDPNIDPQFVVIVNKCLMKKPDDRYSNMAIVAREIAALRRHLAMASDAETVISPARSAIIKAQTALEQGDFAGALTAAQEALRLDPRNSAAREIQTRARAALQVEAWMGDARSHVEQNELTLALRVVEQVLALDRSHPEALTLRQDIEVRRDRERAKRMSALIDAARDALSRTEPDQAAAALVELLQIDPAHPDGPILTEQIQAAIADRHRARERERAHKAIAEAEQLFEAGHHDAAIGSLERFEERFDEIVEATVRLREERSRILERRRQEDQKKRELERERHAREAEAAEAKRAAQTILQGRREFLHGRHADAFAILEGHQPTRPEVSAALAAMRKDLEAIVAQQERERRLATALKQARDAFRRGALSEAADATSDVLRVDPQNREGAALMDRIQRAIAERQEAEQHERSRAAVAARDALLRNKLNEATQLEEERNRETQNNADLATLPEAGIDEGVNSHLSTGQGGVSARKRSSLTAALCVGIAIVLGVVFGSLRLLTNESGAKSTIGQLITVTLRINPWANVKLSTKSQPSQQVTCEMTPCLVSLLPGVYTVHASNPNYRDLDFELVVEPNASSRVVKSMPGFSAEDEAQSLWESVK